MLKKALMLGLLAAAVAGLSAPLWSQDKPAATKPSGGEERKYTFDGNDALAGWKVSDSGAAIDKEKNREGKGGSLKVGAGGKAVLKLADKDGTGKVEMWVHDDGAKPDDAKAARTGPRWGIVQGDGRILAVGILYASYLAGDEGYTASATDGAAWFEQLFWLGINRAPAGWHKWTFRFDPQKGLQVLHNDKPLDEAHAIDPAKTGLKGFNAIAIWGDNDEGKPQTIWVDDVSVTMGGAAAASPAPATKPAETK